MRRGIILYGGPATGKDTVTGALERMGRFEHFRRLKCGPGRSAGYRLIDDLQLAAVRAIPREVVWENERYGATYVIDRSQLVARITSGKIPIVHVGQPEAVAAILATVSDARWLVVELHCPRDVAIERIIARQTGDVDERLRLFDATPPLNMENRLRIDTGRISAPEAADAIAAALRVSDLNVH